MGDTYYLTQLDNAISAKTTTLTNIISTANAAAYGSDGTTPTLISDLATLTQWQNADPADPLPDLDTTQGHVTYANWASANNNRDFVAEYNTANIDHEGNHETTYFTYSTIRKNQNDLDDIIKREQQRLNAKQQTVDDALFQQTRLQTLNNSYRLRYKHYLYMLMIVIVMLVLIIVLNRLGKSLSIIPEAVVDMLYVAVIAGGGFMLYFALLDMRRRDHMDFEKVKLKAPAENRTAAEEGTARRTMISEGDLLGLSLDCVGKDCCPEEGNSAQTIWDEEQNKCIPNVNYQVPESGAPGGGGFTTMKRSVLYEPPSPSFGFAPAQDIKTMDNAHYL